MRALLDTADSLVDIRPDSALAMFDRHESVADSMPTGMQMRYRLLRAKAMNRAFVPFTTDTVMKDVTTWYDRHGNIHERMMAYYLLGCVYRDMGDAPTALVQYNKAVELADTTADDCDWHTLCHIHGQRAELFHKMASPEYELEEWKQTAAKAWRAKDTIMALRAYELQADTYYMMYCADSVVSITESVVELYNRYGRRDLAAGALPSVIYVYLNQRKFDAAKKSMDYFEQYSGFFDSGGNIISGKESYYGTKARYYRAIGKSDSAFVYLKKLLMFEKNITCAEIAYRELMGYYANQHQTDSVVKYSQLYCHINDSAAIIRSAEEINRAQVLYNYNRAQQMMIAKTNEVDNYRIMLVAVGLGIIIIIVTSYRLYSVKRQKQKLKLVEENQKFCDLLSKYESASEDMMRAMQGFERYKKEKEDELKRIRKSIATYQETMVHDDDSDMERAMENNEMVKRLHKLAMKNGRVTIKEMNAMVTFVENAFPEFYARIINVDDKLTEREIIICIMIRLYLIPSEISVLLDISGQNLTNIRSKINRKLFGNDGTKKLDYNLRQLF